MSIPDLIQLLGVLAIFGIVVGVAGTGIRWLWHLTDRQAAARVTNAELEELRARVAELETERSHTAELEERLDFAERLIAQQRDPEQLGRGK
jgi:hypothetical protein